MQTMLIKCKLTLLCQWPAEQIPAFFSMLKKKKFFHQHIPESPPCEGQSDDLRGRVCFGHVFLRTKLGRMAFCKTLKPQRKKTHGEVNKLFYLDHK